MSAHLTLQEVAKAISYCPETGAFHRVSSGRPTGSINSITGYIVVSIGKKTFQGHRIAWLLPSGNWRAKIGSRKTTKYLGFFGSMDEAAHAYNKAAIEYFCEFAVLNPIGADYE